MTSEMERLDKYRSRVQTPSGPASYVDTGGPGRPVLLVHGVGSSSYLWRNVIAELGGERRCVSFDLPLHGYTPAAPDQDFTLNGLARFIAGCCDALDLTDIDLVANDTGGAVSQVFAASNAGRLHTLTLTNCEAHDNVPPKVLLPAVLLARLGLLAPISQRMARDIPRARKRMYRGVYEDIASLPASSPQSRSTAPSSRSSPSGVEVPWALTYCTSAGATPALFSAARMERKAPSPVSEGAVMW